MSTGDIEINVLEFFRRVRGSWFASDARSRSDMVIQVGSQAGLATGCKKVYP